MSATTTPKINIIRAASTMCKRKLSFFVREFWHVIIEDELEWGPHMDAMCDEIQLVYERVINRQPKLYDLIINVPPGTSKSTICTVMAPAWSWGLDASLRHITGSYSDGLSTEHAVKSRDVIKSDMYRAYFPNVQIKPDEDNKTNYKTTRNGQRFATSVGGTVTGVHGHILTYDDPLNPKQASSAAELLTANNYFDKTLSTRKVDKKITPLILIMQRLATNDPTGYLLEKKKDGIRHVCLPGTLSEQVKPAHYKAIYTLVSLSAVHPLAKKLGTTDVGFLDPHRLSADVLAELSVDLGSDGYAGQIDQSPAPEGGLIWQRWFEVVPDELFPEEAQALDLGTDWDLAYTSEEDNAASAYVTSGKVRGKVYIFDFDWRWLEFPALIKWMKEQRGPHYIEAKASGKSAKQVLNQQGVIAIEVPVKGGKDKIARARSATPLAEAGMVCIKKSMAERLYTDSKQGILFFPKNPFKDLADALAQALQRHSTKGIRVMAEDQDDLLDQLGF